MAEQENTPARVGKVVQQATVIFAGAEITAVLAEDGYVYGALPHLCRALGLDADGQRERIEQQQHHPNAGNPLSGFPAHNRPLGDRELRGQPGLRPTSGKARSFERPGKASWSLDFRAGRFPRQG